MESLCAALIRADLDEDGSAFDEVMANIERTNTSAEFLGAAFHVALRRRFSTRSPVDVIRFVGELRAAVDRTGDAIDPTIAEQAIQCVLDGSEPETVFNSEQLVQIEYHAVLKILRDAAISGIELDEFFAECDVVLADYFGSR